MLHIFFLIFLLCTLFLNFLLTNTSPFLGIIINTISIFIYLLLAIYDFYDVYAQDIFSLATGLILINLITIYLHFSDIYLTSVIVYLLLLFISFIYYFKIFYGRKYFNLKNIKYIFIIFPLGISIGCAIQYFLHFTQFAIIKPTILPLIGFIILIAITEEIFFRALIQNAVSSMTDTIIAVIFASILYSAFHFSNNIIYTLLFLILGIIYSSTYSIWRNIYISIGLNIIINITFFVLTSHLLIFALS